MAEEDSTGSHNADDRDLDYWNGVEESIEVERGRLMNAEALIECLISLLTHTDGNSRNSLIRYGSTLVAKNVRTLMKEAINGLDSVRIIKRGQAGRARPAEGDAAQ
jgi:hypothetical protein